MMVTGTHADRVQQRATAVGAEQVVGRAQIGERVVHALQIADPAVRLVWGRRAVVDRTAPAHGGVRRWLAGTRLAMSSATLTERSSKSTSTVPGRIPPIADQDCTAARRIDVTSLVGVLVPLLAGWVKLGLWRPRCARGLSDQVMELSTAGGELAMTRSLTTLTALVGTAGSRTSDSCSHPVP
jgi:hypothetical protein